jgi:DNA adenine methylase
MKYHGGKTKLAAWIIGQMPAHKCYVEPFGGGGAVLLAKKPAKSEVYNDLSGDVVNFFRIIREHGKAFAHLVNMTPFAREEFEIAYEPTDCPMERARRFYIRCDMAVTTTSQNEKSGFRTAINSSMDYSSQFLTWFNRPEAILQTRDRLARVCIENTDAFKLLDRIDRQHTLFYLDPPYYNATRSKKSVRIGYTHNLTDEQHEQLLNKCNQLQGMAMISGYDNPLYNDLLKQWRREETTAYDDAKKARKEVLWMNFEKQGQQILAF